jgi:hypothetical protein
MSTTFKLDTDGNEELLKQLATGFAAFGNAAADAISRLAPENTGRYAGSIKSTTFLEGGIFAGEPVRGKGIQSKAQIWTVIYTTSKLGHLLELGTGPRDVTAKGKLMVWAPSKYGPGGSARTVHQPGHTRRPHFFPGFASVVGKAGQIIGHGARVKRGRVNTRML